MASLNKAQFIGRLGKDPEVRFTAANQAVANFTIAVDETYKDRDGNKQKKTEWVNLVVWGKQAESFVGPYLKKGMLIYAEGKLQSRTWDDRDGNKKYITEVNVSNIVNLESKPAGNSSGSARPAQGRPAQQNRPAPPPVDDSPSEVDEDSIPF